MTNEKEVFTAETLAKFWMEVAENDNGHYFVGNRCDNDEVPIIGHAIANWSATPPKPKLWEPKGGPWQIGINKVYKNSVVDTYRLVGKERSTKQAAVLANNCSNVQLMLSALAHELEGEKKFDFSNLETNYCIAFYTKDSEHGYIPGIVRSNGKLVDDAYGYSPTTVYMTEECATKICEMYNNGELPWLAP